MKFITSILVIVACCSTSWAWISTPSSEKPYAFKFNMNGEKWEHSVKAGTYEEAFEKAAMACKSHFGGYKGMPKDAMDSLIDTCANPRTI